MILTKTEIKVLELFVSRILDSFSIREVSRLIKKDLKIVHTSIKKLILKDFFIKKNNFLRLNYKKNINDLAYIENLRKEDFFNKYDLIKIHVNNFIKKCSDKFFILIVFGSYAAGKATKKSDVDLLLVSDNPKLEKELKSSLAVYDKFHITSVDDKSFLEMLNKREELNVVNETFNNHIILYGAEQYFALLGERDVR